MDNSQQAPTVSVSRTNNDLQQQLVPVITHAKALTVSSDAELVIAKEVVQTIKTFQKEVDSTFDPIIERAHVTHKEALAQKKKHMDPLAEAEKRIKQLIGDYLTLVENERKKEAERLAGIARKERETELRKIQAEIDEKLAQYSGIEEKIGALQEALADADHDKFTLVNAKLAALYAEQEKLTSEAAETQASVNILNLIPSPFINVQAPKVKGLSSKVNLIPQVVNAMALIKAAAEGNVPPTVIDFNMSNIKKLVNAGMKLPGVAVTEQRNVSVRSAG
jgi:DNA repair exonuclease SbcCD ATPase subunit